ncbi:PREDICTED: ATP synthase subunit s-like protein [Dinoponera quadriceps]|uniref:ATP synthase subunit s-like protein n=1 Tax=Dinoponera quadriceps TaxID=609295 RepID=A0A6P3X6J9_DINQU|nr:PREDICTED: ATP synthase subunit s-like protein [Dinoponera quadriceps]
MLTQRMSVLAQKLSGFVCLRDKSLLLIQVRAYGVDHEIRQHEWREKEANPKRSTLNDNSKKPETTLWFSTEAPKEHDFALTNIKNWYEYQILKLKKKNQKFMPQRYEILGANLATAHFIVHRGGRVRFKDSSFWIDSDKDLPNTYDPYYILEAIDVNGFDLRYEGLSNLCNLTNLQWLSMKNCKNIDDWGLDKISAEFPELEYFDISGCEKVTERGLEALYRMINLKKLIVTNHNKSAAFELTCMMLEDCMPGLICEILEPLEISKE